MRRWVPFAIALYMLTPFALWGFFALNGLGSSVDVLQNRLGGVLFLASLPLAGLFWIQNLRQLGDSMGDSSRLRTAQKVTSALPVAIIVIGLVGAGWIVNAGDSYTEAAGALGGCLAMAVFGILAARAPIEPGVIVEHRVADPVMEDAGGRVMLLFLTNCLMAVALAAMVWTPLVILWAAYAAVPVVFAAMIVLAWWAAQGGVVPMPRPRRG